jgi:hypothetical protein
MAFKGFGSDAMLFALCPMRYAIYRRRRDRGEMTELADGARLEIVCSAKSGTEGSNPSLSAMHHVGFMAALNST